MPIAKIIDEVTNSLSRDITKNKAEMMSAVERCVRLLEHAGECRARGVCVDGMHCNRACRVLLHHRVCSMAHCSVCRQLKPLCHLHAIRCQKKDNSCSMPFCPNRKELLNIVHPTRNKTTAAPAAPTSESCVPEVVDRSQFTQMKTADLRECLSAEDKKRITSRVMRVDNLSTTALPFHYLGLRRHLPVKKLRCPVSMLASKQEAVPEYIQSWKAKVSIVPLK